MKSDFTLKRFDAVYAYKNRMEFFREKNYLELLNKAEYFFIQYFFMFYFKCKNTLNVNKNTLKQLKRTFTSELKNILRNPKYNWKEKSMWIVFCVNELFSSSDITSISYFSKYNRASLPTTIV